MKHEHMLIREWKVVFAVYYIQGLTGDDIIEKHEVKRTELEVSRQQIPRQYKDDDNYVSQPSEIYTEVRKHRIGGTAQRTNTRHDFEWYEYDLLIHQWSFLPSTVTPIFVARGLGRPPVGLVFTLVFTFTFVFAIFLFFKKRAMLPPPKTTFKYALRPDGHIIPPEPSTGYPPMWSQSKRATQTYPVSDPYLPPGADATGQRA